MKFFSTVICRDKLKIGSNSYWGTGTFINAYGGVEIGDNVLIAPYCFIHSANHNFEDVTLPIAKQGHRKGKVIIESDCWIGAHSIILPNTRIGKGTVIGAGSVVTKNIPPYSVAMGNPCKVKYSRLKISDVLKKGRE